MKLLIRIQSSKRLLFFILLGVCCGLGLLYWNPVNATSYRLGFLLSLGVLWLTLLALMWKKHLIRYLLISVPFLCAIPFLLPAKRLKQEAIRVSYLQRMRALEGVTYHWGGESARGIDCSGLPRKALRDALLAYGLQHGNGRACRMFLEQWWYDTSAKALSEDYRGFTRALSIRGKINSMSYDGLLPGDLAVTQSKVHTLVYLGDGYWIQADPGIGAVAILHGRKDQNPWFSQEVTMHRWQVLE
ncbi:C40 family peptidase [Verrucomicrobiaceae bacterium N1E253]|uniref:C40 family peptidase n=1 Tax=Oceaniferula marina TaxID=2748318 RepID=A0A851GJ70_9BACT|nr:NlpC/P60 family protein [Oceaniferula marina]NWK57376.1 C40 family peptidase [Oceaniferula marina]